MATDRYQQSFPNIDSVAFDAFAITPSSNDLVSVTRGIYVGGAGNVSVQMKSYGGANSNVTFVGVLAGTILPVRVQKVWSANTTATSMVGLY